MGQGHQNLISSFTCPSNIDVQVWLKSIHSFKRYGADKPFSNNLSPPVTLKMGSRSPKSNQHFSPSQWYICVSLAKIRPFNKEIECGQEATLTPPPTGSALKTICPPNPPWWGDINISTFWLMMMMMMMMIWCIMPVSPLLVILRWWKGDNERLCVMKWDTVMSWILLSTRFKPGTSRSKHYENMPIQIYRKFHLQKLKIFR